MRTLRLQDVNIPGRRIVLAGCEEHMAETSAMILDRWLRERAETWPLTAR